MSVQPPANVVDYELLAAERLEPGVHGYYAGGAGDELTLADNEAAWRRIRILPRVLVDVSQRDLSTTVLGRVRPHPVFVAPTAFHRLATPAGASITTAAISSTTRRRISASPTRATSR